MSRGLGAMIFRIAFIYIYAMLLVRGSGRRTLGSLNAGDLVMIMIMSDMFDDIIWGEVPTAKGVVGMGVLFMMNGIVGYLRFKFPRLGKMLLSAPSVIIRNGKFDMAEVGALRLSTKTIQSIMRSESVEYPDEVARMMIEADGQVATLKNPSSKPAQKIDYEKLRRVVQ